MPTIAVEQEERGEDGRDLNGRFYLDVPYAQRTEAKSRGAVWDGSKRKWYVPPERDVARFHPWLPARDARVAPKPILPSTRAGRLARYYRLVLEHIDLDRLAEAKDHIDLGLAEIAVGLIESQSEDFGRFCEAALAAHDRSPESFNNSQGEAVGANAAPDAQAATTGIEEEPVRFVEIFVLLTLPAFGDDGRNVVAALPVQMSTRGELRPIDDLLPLMNEAHYEPQARPRHPILGARTDLVTAYENLSWPPQQDWTEAWSSFSNLFGAVNLDGSAPEQFRHEEKKLGVRLVPYERTDMMIRYLRQLYLALWVSSDKPEAALYRSLLDGPWYKPLLDEGALRLLGPLHTGHMDPKHGLDPSQRVALKHLIATEPARVLAVSGPPGTGKTACLRGVIATELVNATLDESGPRPPIIVASSATNQAVTNIIKSFGEIAAATSEESVSARWLRVVTSYGWFYASKTKALTDEAQSFQLLDGPREWKFAGAADALSGVVQDKKRRSDLEAEYLRLFRRNFPALHARTVEQATAHLLDSLRQTARGRKDVQGVLSIPVLCDCAAVLGDAAAGPSMEERHRARRKFRHRASRIAFIEHRDMEVAAEITYAESRIEELTSHCLALSLPRFPFALPAWLVTLLLWLKSLFQRERRQQLMRALSVDFDIATLTDPQSNLFALADEALKRARHRLVVNEGSRNRLASRNAVLRDNDDLWVDTAATLERELAAIENGLGLFRRLIATYRSEAEALQWASDVEAGLRDRASPEQQDPLGARELGNALRQKGAPRALAVVERLEQLIDLTVRRRCFELAARYWEGRWLLEDHDRRLTRDREGLVAGLRRQCMLAPVIVATAYRLPKLFMPDDSGEEVLLGVADLLIIDEAGQAPPTVSAGLFALAQRALVVGDVEQLKPIWGIDSAQDRRLMRHARLGDELDTLGRQSLLASSGSAMEMALSASFFRSDSGQAVTLIRHYRCRPTIIQFCNRLVYDHTTPLEPVRKVEADPLFPPMAYVECRFSATRSRGSALNREEADTLISWLVKNRSSIERHHNRKKNGAAIGSEDPGYRDIGDLVAIITPYSSQRDYILKRVRTEFPGGAKPASADMPARPTIARRLIVGTVHALQGAERPLVLFSATSSPDDGKTPFMDVNADMLNVAVSRAQENFVLFGHPGLFFSYEALKPFNRAPSAVLGRYLEAHGAPVPAQ